VTESGSPPSDATGTQRSRDEAAMPSAPRRFQAKLWFAAIALLGVVAAVALPVMEWRRANPLPSLTDIRRWADFGDWERADRAASERIARRPRDAEALMLGARAAAGMGDLERCWNLLGRVPDDAPAKPEALTRQAQTAQAMNLATRCESAWRQLLRIAKTNDSLGKYRFSAQAELIGLLSLQRRNLEVETLLWQIYPNHSEPWRVLIGLARVNARNATSKSTIDLQRRLCASDPTDTATRRGLSLGLIETLQWDEAVEQAKACLELAPDEQWPWEILLECHVRKQEWDAADAAIGHLNRDRAGPRLLRLLAQRFEAANRLQEAEVCYQDAIDADPFDHLTHYQFAQLLQQRDQGDRAQKHLAEFHELKKHEDFLSNFVSLFPQASPEGWTAPDPAQCVAVAENCAALHRMDEARAWLQEALRQRPNWPDALEALRRLE
jgi:thioredoxin-like negative regulator of GroEL